MWTYTQKTGELLLNGTFQGTGYSGTGIGRNNPDAQQIPFTGCTPQGRYTIGSPYTDGTKGPCVMRLTPTVNTDTFGRDGFLIHGDNARHDASEGCIILGPAIRNLIAHSGDHDLTVTP